MQSLFSSSFGTSRADLCVIKHSVIGAMEEKQGSCQSLLMEGRKGFTEEVINAE